MKKIYALVLTTAMLLSFASCGKKDTPKDTKATEANQTQTSESTTAVSQENNETQGTTENSGESTLSWMEMERRKNFPCEYYN